MIGVILSILVTTGICAFLFFWLPLYDSIKAKREGRVERHDD
jgi:hypothetical protein